MAFTPPPALGMTGRSRFVRAARLCAVLAAPLLALAAAPAAAQTVSITSTPANGEYYVAGEAITTRIVTESITSGATHAAQMKLDIGGVERLASSTTSHSAGITTVNFSYTVVATDLDTDGIGIPADSIVGSSWNTGFLPPRVINRNNAALDDQPAHKVIGPSASITSTTPAALGLTNLDGATVTVELGGVTFGSGVTASSFELVTAMAGVSISGVSSVTSGDTTATLTLSAPAAVSAAAPLAVKVPEAAHSGSLDLTTATVNVTQLVSAGSGASTDTRALLLEEGAMGSWDVALSADPGAGCTGGVTIGIASDDSAVTVSPATLTFDSTNWSTAQPVTATAVEDGDLADETATISHMVTATGCASAYPTGLSIASVRVAVDDDDTSLFSIDSPRVVEGDSGPTTMTFTVTLSPAASVQATVGYIYSMAGSAIAGTDHAAIPGGALTFAPGVTTQTISVAVNGDTDHEPDEGVAVQLRNPRPSGFVLATGMSLGSGLIVDDDTPTLTIDSRRVAEGNSGTTEMTFTVTLEPASTEQVTVDWSDAGDGTAASGSDYTTPAGGTLTFAAGETSKPITVSVRGDGDVEPDETVRVRIDNAAISSGTVYIRNADGDTAAHAIGVGTIRNDDTLPAPPPPPSTEKLVLSAAELEVATGAEGASYTLRLGAAPTGAVTVAVSSDNSDVTAAPASLSFDAANWRAPQTVTVTAAADADDYADAAQLTHTASGGGLDGETAVVTAMVSEAGDTRVRAPAAGAAAAAYMVGGHRVEVRAEAGVPPGVEIVPPMSLAADLSVTLRPVSDDVSLAPGVFAFGAAGAQVVVDVSVTGAPAAGLELCLPASAALREASGGRALTLLRHDGTAWVEVAGARLDEAAERVCAAGITEFSPFAVGWRAAAPAVAERSDARTRLAAVNRSILPEVSRAMWDGAASAVARRFGDGAPAGYDGGADANAAAWAADALSWLAGRLGAPGGASAARARGPELFHDPRPYGPPEDSPAPLGAGWRALLPGSAFALGLSGGAAGDGPDAALWGSGDRRSLSLDDGALSWEGEVAALHAGADARTAPDGSGGRVLGGVSASWSESDIDYTDTGGAESVKGRHEVSMASVQPYVGWLAGDGSRAWAALSHGRGEVELADAAAGAADSSATLTAAAIGARTRALSRGAAAVDVKGEAQAARFALDGGGDLIEGLSARTFRLRVAAEGRYVIAFANGGSLTPSLEAGLRWDGGDGAAGAGVELGGGAAWSAPSSPLTLEARGRALLAHGGDAEEWGVGGALRVAPGSGGLGLSLALSPSWGAADSGLARLWSADAARVDTSQRAGGRLDAEAGYGLRALGGVATPLAGFALTGDRSREWRVGGRLALAEALDLALATSLRETRTGAPDRRIALDLRLRW